MHDEMPAAGDIWRHYKGNLYAIDLIGYIEKDDSPAVVYHRMNSPDARRWIRPLEEFVRKFDLERKLVEFPGAET